ncbi:indole-3-glycerol phosphate synthase-domain-containing protein [Sporodiniella umbellata]|nr:indole-3-glycerol phosphate synthase-domain-containing protein [Sporodiniella umbellata]
MSHGDNFTYNVYQYLSCQGANVVVYRNDKISLEEIESLEPVNIVISPGPGHPSQDAGISRAVISHFAGKVPILGICMGQQCMYEVYGGKVSYAGDIVHGKASRIQHDGRGLFRDSLEVTATTEDGIIMGIRHKLYTVEGVQFHPESILCENGHVMMANFLKLRGGHWEQNPGAGVAVKAETVKSEPAVPAPSILHRIYAQRIKDVEAAQQVPGQSMQDLEKLLALHTAPALQDVVARMRSSRPALMAEVKRASPSKGNIDMHANAAEQAVQYALAGASVVSVLTEPKWFQGTVNDLRQVRAALEHLPNRPCVLRKDFIVDRYQILEGRLAGADTVLLIVAMLDASQLVDLFDYARSLGMEALVEVNNAEEMARANALGARLIGVNNRNLHNFDVDMETTSRLAEMVPEGTLLCALSGITGRADVELYTSQGVHGILVGEALMRAWNLHEFVGQLLGKPKQPPIPSHPQPTWVKICGIGSVEAAVTATEEGAHMLGLIFAEKSKRKVSLETAQAIAHAIQRPASPQPVAQIPQDWFRMHRDLVKQRGKKPLLVGVFVNQSVEYMTQMATQVPLDLIQLHGTEPFELARALPVPVIRAFHIDANFSELQRAHVTQPGYHHHVLLDAKVGGVALDEQGGRGVAFDWSLAQQLVHHQPFPFLPKDPFPIILAGGLDPTNVCSAIQQVKPWMVDVSSGVETNGVKDLEKIKQFIQNVRSTHTQ